MIIYSSVTIKFLCFFFLISIISCKEEASSVSGEKISVEEMIGQMILTGARGMEIEDFSEQFKNQIKNGSVGGIVLFDYDVINKEYNRNIKSPEQVKNLISDFQALSPTPLFMAVDQEGGRVNRLKETYGFPKSVSAQYLGELNNLDSTRFYAKINAETLSQTGFNVNFSPAVDLNLNPDNPVIGRIGRSYSDDPEIVIEHAGVWIQEQKLNGILSTLKHFPGHGSSDADSHYGVTDITKYWKSVELEPFKQLGEKHDQLAIMTAHVLNTNLDSVPATLSRNIIQGILRDSFNFNGIIFSDDLHMKAVNAMFSFSDIIQKSLEAGVDMFVFGNNLEYDEMIPEKIIEAVKLLIKEGKVNEDRISESYNRIMDTKKKIGLIN